MAGTKLIVGLGNPGREYAKTRHNLGFMVAEALAKKAGVAFGKCRYAKGLIAEVREGDTRVLLLLPQTYMNHSGEAVGAVVRFDKLELSDILVVCDDIRLEFGQIRLKSEGSDGGHNGLKSIIAHLGSSAFARLRMGVGEPRSPEQQVDHVLSAFSAAERERLDAFVEDAAGCLAMWLNGETDKAMTRYNKRKDQ